MRLHPSIDKLDRTIGGWMESYGHVAHRFSLAFLFIWFGLLKQFGYKTTTSLLAHTIYWGSPDYMVPILGWWEFAIGVSLLVRPLIRLGILLLMIRLPGTLLAFILLPEICFERGLFVPTPEGQYLVKDLVLFTAAMIIGGTVREEHPRKIFH